MFIVATKQVIMVVGSSNCIFTNTKVQNTYPGNIYIVNVKVTCLSVGSKKGWSGAGFWFGGPSLLSGSMSTNLPV